MRTLAALPLLLHASWASVASAQTAPDAGAASKKVSVKEVVFDSAVADIQWMAPDHRTVLLQTRTGRLYRSTNGGDNWNDITDQLKVSDSADGVEPKSVIVDQLTISQADKNIVMVTGTKRNHFISVNAGSTWRRVRQQATIHTFMFHKKRPKWALLSSWTDACEANKGKDSKPKGDAYERAAAAGGDAYERAAVGEVADTDKGPCNHMLYITKDLGRTFALVSSYVVQFSWGDSTHNQEDRIYFTHFRQKKGDQPKLSLWSKHVDFVFTDDGGHTVTRLVYRGNKFLVSRGFIFVAKLKDPTSQAVNLMCSSDGGQNFRAAQLPQELEEKSYTVLDTSEGAVALHVNHGTKEPYGVGNVYISDKDGVRFSLSLPNNVRSSTGDCEFDKVLSLDGVYLANFKDIPRSGDSGNEAGAQKVTSSKKAEAAEEADEMEQSASEGTEVDKRRSTKAKGKEESVVRTVISFDKGGLWSYLKPPRVDSLGKKIDCPPERCWLHLHGITNFHNYAPFYSTENAVGIIMGTGNVGPYLRFEPDQINTYLSRDGGLNFVEAHKGAYIYEIGDHGGLLVMADDVRKTKQVVFSWNEGQSWYDFELSEFPIEVDNVVIEPNATSTKFLLYGTRGGSGVLYHLDFDVLGQPLCKGVWAADSVSSDYETWQPSDGRGSEKCMLGRQVTYTRRKQTSECFNGEKFERPIVKKNCACTEENFDCEMGFARKVGSVECRLAEDYMTVLNVPAQCASSGYYYADAYRKVVGDSCEGGWQPSKVGVPCPSNTRLSRGAFSVLGTIVMIATFMGAAAYLSRSEQFKGWFANYGFDSFNTVKYANIGANAPETALDSVGTRYDADFIEDEFADDAPQLLSYHGGAQSRHADRHHDEVQTLRRIDTAAAQVPRLQAPPAVGGGGGGGALDDDGVDLL